MKMKQLTMAVAAASVVVSGAAVAGGHGDAVSSALSSAKVSGEVYGAYRSQTTDVGATSTDVSDFDLEEARLGITANLDDDTELGVEMGWDTGDGFGGNSGTLLRDLYVAKSYGNAVVTAGRFKQVADRDNNVEKSDALFTLPGEVSLSSLGAMRRIDGVEVKSTFEGGLHGSLALYKGGNDFTGGDIEREFGYAGSFGWQGGNDDASFGATVSLFDEAGTDPGGNDTDGFAVSTFLATGPITGTLSYGDNESEPVGGGTKTESDGLLLQAALDLGGAARGFDSYGVYQGPNLSEGDMGYEVALEFNDGESETGAAKSESDGFKIGLNMYCGQFSKWFIHYFDQETEVGAVTTEVDGFALGGRLDF